MAEPQSKWKENIAGPFYVDDHCIGCNACVKESPRFFKMNEEAMHAFVYNRPITAKECEEFDETLQLCPVDAIGHDAGC